MKSSEIFAIYNISVKLRSNISWKKYISYTYIYLKQQDIFTSKLPSLK